MAAEAGTKSWPVGMWINDARPTSKVVSLIKLELGAAAVCDMPEQHAMHGMQHVMREACGATGLGRETTLAHQLARQRTGRSAELAIS